jgi:phosphatidylserine decarboxylase
VDPVRYYDRASGQIRTERIYARPILDWLYNRRSGRLVAALVAHGPLFSEAWGLWQRRRRSRCRIRPFVEAMGIDLAEVPRPVEDFRSFADFFTREIDLGRRPLPPDPRGCAAPVDGKVLAFSPVGSSTCFPVKGKAFRLDRLLGDGDSAESFRGGSVLICRLSLADYHHVHFPDSGTAGASRRVPGRYHAGGPYARRHLVPYFTENARVVTPFASDHFGSMAIVEVGALTVGSIRQRYQPGAWVARGERKAVFGLGGSTVVLVFGPGAITLDPDLLARSASELETYVKLGASVGTAP